MDKDIFKGVAGEGIELHYLKTENKDKENKKWEDMKLIPMTTRLFL